MPTQPTLRRWLIGLTVGILLALWIAPATRWLVRLQTAWPLYRSAFGVGTDSTRRAAQSPNDFQIQLACSGRGTDRVAALRALEPRFGSQPSLYANLLRYETQRNIHLHRDEDYLLQGHPIPATRNKQPLSTPQQLADFDREAAMGERLDPDNAYFPMMRAVGFFAAHRDTEALAAVERASTKTQWREYYQDEYYGQLRATEKAFGGREAIASMVMSAAVLYPQYAYLRGAARVIVYTASRKEQAGDREGGLRLRRALMRCGDLMRVESTSYIGSLVGYAIEAIATTRPGGMPPLAPPTGTVFTGDQRAQMRLAAYVRYARSLGHDDAAREAQAAMDGGRRMKGLWEKAQGKAIYDVQTLRPLILWQVADVLLLANALWLLLWGGIGRLLFGLPSVRAGEPLPLPARQGIALGLTASVLLIAPSVALPRTIGVWLVLDSIAVWLLTRRDRRQGMVSAGTVFAWTLLVTLLTFALIALPTFSAGGLLQALPSFSASQGADGSSPPYPTYSVGLLLLAAALSSLVPALLLGILAIAARVRRVPASVGLANGLRAACVPLACLLLIAYGGVVLGTVREERRVNAALEQSVRHEGRYLASVAHLPWPGRVL